MSKTSSKTAVAQYEKVLKHMPVGTPVRASKLREKIRKSAVASRLAVYIFDAKKFGNEIESGKDEQGKTVYTLTKRAPAQAAA